MSDECLTNASAHLVRNDGTVSMALASENTVVTLCDTSAVQYTSLRDSAMFVERAIHW